MWPVACAFARQTPHISRCLSLVAIPSDSDPVNPAVLHPAEGGRSEAYGIFFDCYGANDSSPLLATPLPPTTTYNNATRASSDAPYLCHHDEPTE